MLIGCQINRFNLVLQARYPLHLKYVRMTENVFWFVRSNLSFFAQNLLSVEFANYKPSHSLHEGQQLALAEASNNVYLPLKSVWRPVFNGTHKKWMLNIVGITKGLFCVLCIRLRWKFEVCGKFNLCWVWVPVVRYDVIMWQLYLESFQ